jgi:hypothetical protein
MKTKTKHIGKYITTYNGNFETSFTVTEDTAKDHKYYTSIGLGYLFEESTPKAKYTGVENTKKTKEDETQID